MATVISTNSALFLGLDGKTAGPLRTAQPASVQLTGCLLCGMDEEPLGGAADRIATLTLQFDVRGIRLSLA